MPGDVFAGKCGNQRAWSTYGSLELMLERIREAAARTPLADKADKGDRLRCT